MDKITYQGQTLTRWRVGRSTFLALPEHGARLLNWNVELGDGSVRDVIYWPENADFGNVAKVRGGNPILFPFNGRCFDQGEIFHWRTPDGVRRPMPMHGLARQGRFRLTHVNDRGFSAVFEPGEEACTAYPFDYEFTVSYRFSPLGLTCELKLENLGRVPLPWSAGHHFYFTLPWNAGAKRADHLIRILASKYLRQDASGRLVPGPTLKTQESLSNPALIDTFHAGLRDGTAVFGEQGAAGDVTVRLAPGEPTPAEAVFVTWTAAEDAPFYCVEPWMGPPNAPENQTGLHWVPPGKIARFVVEVAVQ